MKTNGGEDPKKKKAEDIIVDRDKKITKEREVKEGHHNKTPLKVGSKYHDGEVSHSDENDTYYYSKDGGTRKVATHRANYDLGKSSKGLGDPDYSHAKKVSDQYMDTKSVERARTKKTYNPNKVNAVNEKDASFKIIK